MAQPNNPTQIVPGKPILQSYPTPNLADRIFVVAKDRRAPGYKLPEKGDKYDGPDPDRLDGFIFATAKPADQVGWENWFYVKERLNEDDYNYTIEYPWVSNEYPRVIRTYVTLREEVVVPEETDKDPKNADLSLIEYRLTRSDDPVIDAVFVAVQKVFERVPAPTDFSLAREDAIIPYAMRTAVPATTVTEFQDGPATAADAAIDVEEEDWNVVAKTISAFKRQVTRVKRIIPGGIKILARGRKLTNDQQLATVTHTWKIGNQTITPRATLIDASIDDVGNNTTLLEEVEVPDVFPAVKFGTQISDLVPPEFDDAAPVETNAITTEGQAQMPVLGVGELSRTDEQLTEFNHRESVSARDITQLPKTLVDHELDGIGAKGSEFGGDFKVSRTLAVGEQTTDQGFSVTKSRVKHIGRGMTLKETSSIATQPATLLLTAGGSGYTCAPTVVFTDPAATTAAATAHISHVTPPDPTDTAVTVELTYAFDGDTKGVFYYLGKLGQAAWSNPVTRGELTLDVPFYGLEFGTYAQIVDREPSNVYTPQSLAPTLVVDLGPGRSLIVKKLSFRARSDYNSATRTFNIQGSNNGTTWIDLQEIPVSSVANEWTTHRAKSDNDSENIPYRYFRLLQPVPNDLSPQYFMVGELELYGTFTHHGSVSTIVSGSSVTGVTITDPGAYPSPPTVTFGAPPAGTTATGTAELDINGGVSRIIITNPGSGYVTAPSITFSSPSSSTAATAIIGKSVQSITITNGGSNYLSPPAVVFGPSSSNGVNAGGAAGIAVLKKTVSSAVVLTSGSGYTSNPTITFQGDGTGAAGTAVRGFPVASFSVTAPGSGFTTLPAVQITGGGGSGATAHAVFGQGISSVDVVQPGSGYTSAPTVAFTGGGGTGAAATANLGFPVDSIAVDDGGSLFTSPPTVTITGDGTGAIAVANLALDLSDLTLTNPGSGFTSDPTVGITGGGGTGATATADVGYGVASISVDSGGTGYTTPPTVVITGDGTGAVATAVLTADAVTSITIDDPGEGYTTAPTITFTGGGGTGAAGTATLESTGVVKTLTLTNPGSGFTSTPTVSITGGGGTGATAIASMDVGGHVASIIVQAAGSGYTTAPVITLTGGGGTGATATATLGTVGVVKSFTVTNAGSGYTTHPVVGLSGGGGTGATAVASLGSQSDSIVKIILDSPGSGYTSAPTVTIIGGGGSGATATATLSTTGVLKSITITNAGTGYTLPPLITVSGGGGTGATARAVLSAAGSVKSVLMTSGGSKYINAPSVTFVAPASGGSGAAGTANLSATGSVVALILTNPGPDYVNPPIVSFTGCSGTGAAALYVLPVGWPVLYDTDTDAETGIVVESRKEIVPAGTIYPGQGYVEIQALDRWRSIQITSGIDLHSIPPTEFFGTWRHYDFPNQLLEVRAVWSTAASQSLSGAPGGYSQGIGGTDSYSTSSSGSAIIKIAHGYSGMCEAEVQRMYVYGPPAMIGIPCPLYVQPSSGTVILRGGSQSKSVTTRPTSLFDVPGQQPTAPLASSSSVSSSIGTQAIGPVLTGGAQFIDPTAITLTDINGVTFTAQGGMVVDLPPSQPLSFTPGDTFISEVIVTKWRFNLWVIDVVRITVPPCVTVIGGSS